MFRAISYRTLFLILMAGALAPAQTEGEKGKPQEKKGPEKEAAPLSAPKPAGTKAPEVAPAEAEAKAVMVAPAAPVDPKTYKIGAEDVILIRVWREPELSGPSIVRPDGMITIPLSGDLQAAGLTPEELGRAVEEALSKTMVKPQVIVSVTQVNSRRYYITGEVNKTGAFPLVVPTTVLEALSQAGGLKEFANGGKIVILRGEKRIKFNYKDVVKGKNIQQNIQLEHGDHVIVP
jgi:polysaccharide biosynthesis/export protein